MVAPETLALVVGVVFLGGAVKGLAGFGYAVASTAVLATVLDPATAVVVMILPTLGANVYLLGELDREDVRPCVERFWPFVAAAMVGTAAGMLALRSIPTRYVALGLGALTLGYVALKQPWLPLPGVDALTDRCFRPGTGWKAVVGLAAGLVFGASNIAVQVVAYLDSLDLDHSTFVGVLAMVLVGISTLRVGIAGGLGLYDAGDVFLLSVLAVLPGLAGVKAGGAVRPRVPERIQLVAVVALLAVIGVRLTLAGLGVA
jgi:uncharacterized membrane protein YfcA